MREVRKPDWGRIAFSSVLLLFMLVGVMPIANYIVKERLYLDFFTRVLFDRGVYVISLLTLAFGAMAVLLIADICTAFRSRCKMSD